MALTDDLFIWPDLPPVTAAEIDQMEDKYPGLPWAVPLGSTFMNWYAQLVPMVAWCERFIREKCGRTRNGVDQTYTAVDWSDEVKAYRETIEDPTSVDTRIDCSAFWVAAIRLGVEVTTAPATSTVLNRMDPRDGPHFGLGFKSGEPPMRVVVTPGVIKSYKEEQSLKARKEN